MLIRLSLILLFVLCLPCISQAASFDCVSTTDEISKVICSDKNLSDKDSELASAYKGFLEKLSNQFSSSQNNPHADGALVKALEEQIHREKHDQSSWLTYTRGACSVDFLPGQHDQTICLRKLYIRRMHQLKVDTTLGGYGGQTLDYPWSGKLHLTLTQDNEPNLCKYIQNFGAELPDNEQASIVPLDQLHIYDKQYNHDMMPDNIDWELRNYKNATSVSPEEDQRLGGMLYMASYDFNNSGKSGLLVEWAMQSHMTGATQEDFSFDDLEQFKSYPTWQSVMNSPHYLSPFKNAPKEITGMLGGGYDHTMSYIPFRFGIKNYFYAYLGAKGKKSIWIFEFLDQTHTKTACLFSK